MNAKAVWIAHFWEVPGFSKSPPREKGDADYDKPVDFPSVRFEQEVLHFIKNGVAKGPRAEEDPEKYTPLSQLRDQLEDAAVWIITPERNSKPLYRAKIPDMKEALKAELKGTTKWHDRLYVKPPPRTVAQVLFEYDPSPERARLMFTDRGVIFDGKPGTVGR